MYINSLNELHWTIPLIIKLLDISPKFVTANWLPTTDAPNQTSNQNWD